MRQAFLPSPLPAPPTSSNMRVSNTSQSPHHPPTLH
jgi:hypothetical protein